MFHFSEFPTNLLSKEQSTTRLDVCSGQFKHIPLDIIDQSLCIIRNQNNQILLLKNLQTDQYSLFGGQVNLGESPKQTAINSARDFGIELKSKDLYHLCYQKTCELQEGETDNSGNPRWENVSVQVVYLGRVQEDQVRLEENSEYQLLWVEIADLGKYIKRVFGLEKTVEIVKEQLEARYW